VSPTTAAKGTGALGLEWDDGLGTNAQLKSSLVTIPEGLKGKNGVISCQVKQTAGTITQTFTVSDGTNDLFTPILVSANTSTFTDNRNNFIFPSSGSLQVKFYGNNSADPILYIDDCKITLADNIGTVAQAYIIGSALTPATANCSWASTSVSYANFSADADCPTPTLGGIASAPATKIPAITFASLPAGEYEISVRGSLRDANNDLNGCAFAISDGTTRFGQTNIYNATGSVVSGITSRIKYTTAQSNITFQMQLRSDNGGNTCQISASDTGSEQSFEIIVKYFPTSSQQAVSSANADYSGATYTLTSSNTQGFGTPTGSCTHDRVGGNLLLDCKMTSGTSTAVEARLNLPNGLVSADTTRIPSIQIAGYGVLNASTSDQKVILIEPSVGYVTFGTQGSVNNGLAKLNGSSYIAGTQIISFKASIPIQSWTSNQRAATLVGSVTSNSSGAERIERVKVTSQCTSTPCTIADQSGSWVTSITRASVGNYTINFSSSFSSAPTCVCTLTGFTNTCQGMTTTTSSANFTNNSAAGALTDGSFGVICIGPR
jgi:hypothetical protein